MKHASELAPGFYDEGLHVTYDFDVRFLGQRYLLQQKYGPDYETVPGYTTIPVED